MLGSINLKTSWNWTACGKHPVAADYFSAGSDNPLLKALSDWVKNGYRILGPRNKRTPNLYSWRFWAGGAGKGNLICGIVRDSSDSLGRPYPLLIMGTGSLKGWRDHWEFLPFACEKTWSQIEYLSARRFMDFKQLEEGVRMIDPPDSDWSTFQNQSVSRSDLKFSLGNQFHSGVDNFAKDTDFLLPLDCGPLNDCFKAAALWHLFLKTRLGNRPNAVFMGGVPEKTFLSLINHALVPNDFVRLWSVCKARV